MEARPARSWRIADVFEFREHQGLFREGNQVAIEQLPLRLLFELVRHPEHALDKAALIDRVWDGREVGDGAIALCVKRLRLALGDEERRLVRSERGRGYRLAATVSAIAPPGVDALVATTNAVAAPVRWPLKFAPRPVAATLFATVFVVLALLLLAAD